MEMACAQNAKTVLNKLNEDPASTRSHASTTRADALFEGGRGQVVAARDYAWDEKSELSAIDGLNIEAPRSCHTNSPLHGALQAMLAMEPGSLGLSPALVQQVTDAIRRALREQTCQCELATVGALLVRPPSIR